MTVDTVDLVNDRLAADLDRAFPDLMRELQAGVYSGVRRMVPTGADAEDITQEVFIRAYRAMDGYPPERIRQLNLPGWIWTIAVNLCRNAARTRSRRPRTVELDRDAFEAGMGPEASAVLSDENRRWADRLSQLSSPQRTAVVLRHVAGLSYADIAEATGRVEGTVKADVHRGIAKLKETVTT
ncbi:MAG: sigma-70 family RNA polymerase sigma factor [Acidimicrobiia bacterium]|nr:sigma-70 family RNA polymerase sigma factor [Acidimicrobiia bacterium]